MVKIISFDMDGTLVDSTFTDLVWLKGIPCLYAKKTGLSFEEAKAYVIGEYKKVGEGAIEWYDIQYWFRFFQFDQTWRTLMRQYAGQIRAYQDARHILERLEEDYSLVLTSNAGREFIDIEMEVTGMGRYFDRIFSATSDFRVVKKTAHFYRRICEILETDPGKIVHVGDHYEFDYLVPKSLGIQAFYLDRSGKKNGDSVLSDLRELEKRLLPAANGRPRIRDGSF
jgi:putative hydrolase of the HAD superfamily